MQKSVVWKKIGGSVEAPPSKSSMQRAIACAILAQGKSTLKRTGNSADCLAALGIARDIGALVFGSTSAAAITADFAPQIRSRLMAAMENADSGSAIPANAAPPDGRAQEIALEGIAMQGIAIEGIAIQGIGGIPNFAQSETQLNCGESGLCMRMFAPILALSSHLVTLEAQGSLRSRDMTMVENPLRQLGVECSTHAGTPPIRIRGPIKPGRYSIEAGSSSQFLTGLLLALPLAHGDSKIEAPNLASGGYVDLTIDTMRQFGVSIEGQAQDRRFFIQGEQRYRACDFTIEGDWSGAAFLLVAAALAAGPENPLQIAGLDVRSTQPDRAVMEALARCGASVSARKGDIVVCRDQVGAISMDLCDCPDLFPPLAILAASAVGISSLRGVQRLASKESDRARALVELVNGLGGKAWLEGEYMLIEGGSLKGGRVRTYKDHRIAMAAAIASCACANPVEIDDAECVSKSWPDFFSTLEALVTRHTA